ncbi:MAG TPA: hypothetical protein IAA58_09160 [Candidatus Gallacutalibacter stercoravium]|nr:hypothetical protein [Candidatus Gallacutalibacter stercoravium]
MDQELANAVKRRRDFYSCKPGAQIYKKEFGYFGLDNWIAQGYLKPYDAVADYDVYLQETFGYSRRAESRVGGLGWCEAGFYPAFEEKVLEDRGDYELVQDFAGRSVLYFKGRRNGFMPEYVDHPVKDMDTWERNVKWRMDPNTPGREELTRREVQAAAQEAQYGSCVIQAVVGGYMYLRSLMGPEALLYQFYDNPALIHACMRAWFELADAVIERHQQTLCFDELFLGEDICYNHGPLISPDMIREFLLPYYQQLYTNMKRRQARDPRPLHFQIDTDGFCPPVIALYQSIGADYFSPFEVAAGCDVVKLGRQYPGLLISGGIDKRELAKGRDAIDRHLEAIMPAMRARGGYIPTCDHGVPEEVSFENYAYFRTRLHTYCD